MKIKAILGTVVFVLLVGFAGPANAVVINFDGFSDGDILAVGTFDALGVRFDQTLEVDDGDAGTLPSSAPNAAFNTDSFGGDITGFFLGPVASVDFISVFAGDECCDTDTVTLTGFNAADAIVDSDTFTAAAAQTLSIFGPGMVRFTIIQIGLIGIDDFTFTPEDVPEPGTLAIFGFGLLGLGLARRRRKAA